MSQTTEPITTAPPAWLNLDGYCPEWLRDEFIDVAERIDSFLETFEELRRAAFEARHAFDVYTAGFAFDDHFAEVGPWWAGPTSIVPSSSSTPSQRARPATPRVAATRPSPTGTSRGLALSPMTRKRRRTDLPSAQLTDRRPGPAFGRGLVVPAFYLGAGGIAIARFVFARTRSVVFKTWGSRTYRPLRRLPARKQSPAPWLSPIGRGSDKLTMKRYCPWCRCWSWLAPPSGGVSSFPVGVRVAPPEEPT